jgi:DNA/RNA endonuclease YhcR with UshA esterase domain
MDETTRIYKHYSIKTKLMNENTLLNISLMSSIVGILLILFITENIEPPEYKIKDITNNDIDKLVKITGELSILKETEGLYLLKLFDGESSIVIVAFKNEEIILNDNERVTIKGKIVEYNNEFELQAEEIIKTDD